MICEWLVVGLLEDALSEKMQSNPDLILEKAINMIYVSKRGSPQTAKH